MPRQARKKSATGIYHVMQRGINRQTIFEDDEDCTHYLQCLADLKRDGGFKLFAYCLMGNHIHLLLQEDGAPLEHIFRRLGAKYVYWYNWKYQRVGHLFQGRFKSDPVKDDAHFLAALRYILQNPVRAGICADMADYRWSSYALLDGAGPLIDRDEIFAISPRDALMPFLRDDGGEAPFLEPAAARLNDAAAGALIREGCGLASVKQFAGLDAGRQREQAKALQARGVSIRQLARLTGLTKARVEQLLS